MATFDLVIGSSLYRQGARREEVLALGLGLDPNVVAHRKPA
jgi:hypothetical protein